MEAPSLAPASEAVTEALALPFLVVPDAVAREGNRLSPTAFGKLPLNNIELEDFDAPDNGAATGAVHCRVLLVHPPHQGLKRPKS